MSLALAMALAAQPVSEREAALWRAGRVAETRAATTAAALVECRSVRDRCLRAPIYLPTTPGPVVEPPLPWWALPLAGAGAGALGIGIGFLTGFAAGSR